MRKIEIVGLSDELMNNAIESINANVLPEIRTSVRNNNSLLNILSSVNRAVESTLQKVYVVTGDKIYCGDSVSVLKGLPANSVDLAIMSPPYDQLRTYNGFNFDYKKLIDELYGVMKKGGVVVWVVTDATNIGETGTQMRQALYFMGKRFHLHDTMYYEKNSCSHPASPKGNRYSQVIEHMYVFSKEGKPKTAKLICDKPNRWAGKPTFGTPSLRSADGKLKKYNKKRVTPDFSPRSNIWHYFTGKRYTAKDSLAHKHPAVMPYLLVFDHVRTWSDEGDVVLDVLAGSGQTCLIAKVMGRQFIANDCSIEYCRLIQERLETCTALYDIEEMEKESQRQNNSRYRQDSPSQVKNEEEE